MKNKTAVGTVYVLSAPSGCGKTTILKKVMKAVSGVVFSISHTTRSPRPKEKNGHDYHFIDSDQFIEIRDQSPSGFVEWAEVHGNMYGTSRQEVNQRISAGFDVVLDIDVQGARQIKAAMDCVSIFITPPSVDELETRLRRRGTEKEETIRVRLDNAKEELKATAEYDYLVMNDILDDAVQALSAIIIAERCRNH